MFFCKNYYKILQNYYNDIKLQNRGYFSEKQGYYYDNRIQVKYTSKWGVRIAGMVFQTRSGEQESIGH